MGLLGAGWSELMEETLKEILRTLKDYGDILKHIDGRMDAMEGSIELIRQNQVSINQREAQLEKSCQDRHAKIDEMLENLSRRVSAIESRLTPIPLAVGEEG